MMGKLTSEIIDEITASFDRVGGQAYLDELALRDPPTFCKLLALVVRAEIRAETPNQTNRFNLGKEMAKASARFAKPDSNQ